MDLTVNFGIVGGGEVNNIYMVHLRTLMKTEDFLYWSQATMWFFLGIRVNKKSDRHWTVVKMKLLDAQTIENEGWESWDTITATR